jgi:hypothetical protein
MKFTLSRSRLALNERIANLPKQVRFAVVGALTDTVFAVRGAEQQAMRAVFDRVTPYILRSVRARRPQDLARNDAGGNIVSAVVDVEPFGTNGSASPERTLQAEVFGGRRSIKAAERRLQQLGVMPAGWAMVPSVETLADSSKTNQYGNVRGPFIRRLLSYFGAFLDAGYSGNMSARTKANLARRGRTGDKGPERNARAGIVRIDGVEYFISRGQGTYFGRRGWKGGRNQHLPAGIWRKRGIHGADIAPVFLFVPPPNYPVRLRFFDVAQNVANRDFAGHFERRFAAALRTAKTT